LKAGLKEITHPETGQPLVERVYEGEELYHGPHTHLAPDLTVVLHDWRYRTIGLHDFTTHRVISPAFGPTGDHRMEGVLIAAGPAFRPGSSPHQANLLDIAPTVLHLLGVPIPEDMDGRILTELLDLSLVPAASDVFPIPAPAAYSRTSSPGNRVIDGNDNNRAVAASVPVASPYTAEEDAAIQQRLADLGYL
jgi:hypothetical protein